jgi:hypothetical protein
LRRTYKEGELRVRHSRGLRGGGKRDRVLPWRKGGKADWISRACGIAVRRGRGG